MAKCDDDDDDINRRAGKPASPWCPSEGLHFCYSTSTLFITSWLICSHQNGSLDGLMAQRVKNEKKTRTVKEDGERWEGNMGRGDIYRWLG